MSRSAASHNKTSYRSLALKLFPWICAHCGREFDGKKLNQLTVHHKDHNHDNNPLDGSNWELLCLYCHDNEHQRYLAADTSDESPPRREPERPSTFTPFARFADVLKRKQAQQGQTTSDGQSASDGTPASNRCKGTPS